jgi:hypothetical protein
MKWLIPAAMLVGLAALQPSFGAEAVKSAPPPDTDWNCARR